MTSQTSFSSKMSCLLSRPLILRRKRSWVNCSAKCPCASSDQMERFFSAPREYFRQPSDEPFVVRPCAAAIGPSFRPPKKNYEKILALSVAKFKTILHHRQRKTKINFNNVTIHNDATDSCVRWNKFKQEKSLTFVLPQSLAWINSIYVAIECLKYEK